MSDISSNQTPKIIGFSLLAVGILVVALLLFFLCRKKKVERQKEPQFVRIVDPEDDIRRNDKDAVNPMFKKIVNLQEKIERDKQVLQEAKDKFQFSEEQKKEIFKENIVLSDQDMNILNDFFKSRDCTLSIQEHYTSPHSNNHFTDFHFRVPDRKDNEFTLLSAALGKIFKSVFGSDYYTQGVSFGKEFYDKLEKVSSGFGEYYTDAKCFALKALMLDIIKKNVSQEVASKLIDENEINTKKELGTRIDIDRQGISELSDDVMEELK